MCPRWFSIRTWIDFITLPEFREITRDSDAHSDSLFRRLNRALKCLGIFRTRCDLIIDTPIHISQNLIRDAQTTEVTEKTSVTGSLSPVHKRHEHTHELLDKLFRVYGYVYDDNCVSIPVRGLELHVHIVMIFTQRQAST